MKASELRIGNLVDWNGEIAKISQLLELEVVFKCGETDLYTALKPIPLTEEWLLRFGFEFKNGYGYTFKYGYITKKDKYWVYHNICQKIEFVHQLQNLFFALTQKELEL